MEREIVHWFFHGTAIIGVTSLVFMVFWLRRRLLFDGLTGVYSRFAFEDQWPVAVATAGRSDRCVGLLFIDGDGMKQTNDTHGHAAGDRFIRRLAKAIASALTKTVRLSDKVYRWGGDEFVVILTAPDGMPGMRRAVNRVLDAMNEHNVAASVGWAMFSPDDFSGEIAQNQTVEMAAKTLSTADANMRLAKQRKDGLTSHAFPE